MNSAVGVAVNAHYVATCVHIPCLRKRSVGIIKRDAYSAAHNISASAVEACISEKSDHHATALGDTVVHKAATIQATKHAAEEAEASGI